MSEDSSMQPELPPSESKPINTTDMDGQTLPDWVDRSSRETPHPGSSQRHPFEAPTPAEVNRLLPNYAVTILLGKGGMGAVYYGFHMILERPVAIKILVKDQGTDFAFADRFKREARAMAALEHPNIVKVYDFGTAGDFYYIVMEYVDGADLKKVIRSGQISASQVFQIMAQVCQALEYAHALGLVHRDIKPANILLNRQGQVKVCDFGLAKVNDGHDTGLTMGNVAMGTPEYIAPEALIIGSGKLDPRADVYSLGVMLYEMFTGQIPRGNHIPTSKQNPEVHPQLDTIIDKALAADPDSRYRDVTLFAADLERVRRLPRLITRPAKTAASKPETTAADEVQTDSDPKLSASPPQNAGRRYVWGFALSALMATGLIAMGAWWFRQDSPKPDRPGRTAEVAASEKTTGATLPIIANPLVQKGPSLLKDGWRPIEPYTSEAIQDGWYQQAKSRLDDADPNVVIRAKMRLKVGANPQIFIRETPSTDGGNSNYVAQVVTVYPEHRIRLHIRRSLKSGTLDSANSRQLGEWILPRPLADDEVFEFAFGAAGDQLVVWFNGEPVIQSRDSTLRGRIHFVSHHGESPSEFRDIAWQPLTEDGLGEVSGVSSNRSIQQVSELSKPPANASKSVTAPAAATKESPFQNSLGMRFVPVPIAGGPTGGQLVLFSIWETRVRDYRAFAESNDRKWYKPGFEETDDHPAVRVSWDDASAFCNWLTEKERSSGRVNETLVFRLPTDHEWSCAVGIGDREDPAATPKSKDRLIKNVYPWGMEWPPPSGSGNFLGMERYPKIKDTQISIEGYKDGHLYSAPVGQFTASKEGLYDLGGNVAEWCFDWYDTVQANNRYRVTRGSGWGYGSQIELNASYRPLVQTNDPSHDGLGFRVVLGPPIRPAAATADQPAPVSTGGIAPETATKDASFQNSLGIRFVPVPIAGGPTGGQLVLFSIWETRVRDYRRFVDATKRKWPTISFSQTPDHPAVKVSWDDAVAFCVWLTEHERSARTLGGDLVFRLPTDHEWSCAVGIGDREDAEVIPKNRPRLNDVYPWGATWPPPPGSGNLLGEEVHTYTKVSFTPIIGYDDGFDATAPVGRFPPNSFGLYDLGGNVAEWCLDFLDPGARPPVRVYRGLGYSYADPKALRSTTRSWVQTDDPFHDGLGFRVVLGPPISVDTE